MRKKLRTLGPPAVLVLIVIIGILNVCLGFGLAMYFGYGPPGLDGIFQALGPMPAMPSNESSPVAVGMGALYIPGGEPSLGGLIVASEPTEPFSEEGVLGDVRELNAAAQTAMSSAAAQSPQ